MKSVDSTTVKLNKWRAHSASDSVESQRMGRGVGMVLGALQRTAGNHATGRLLDAFAGKPPPETGMPLDEATRREMETRFGEDFGSVRLHTGGAAAATARDVGAEAFTTGNDISFTPGRYRVDSRESRSLLAHELAHVIQQRRGGVMPVPGVNSAAEQEATATAQNYDAGAGSLSVSASTSAGMACSVDDWLEGTPDISTWRYSQLENERNELNEWLGRQTVGTNDSILIEEAVAQIEARMVQLQKGVAGPKKRSKKAKGKQAAKAAAEGVTPAVPDLPPPRCLVEQKTVQMEDPEEIREEFDLIVAWLQRTDLTKDERWILQMQLHNLAPQVGVELQQRATERRQAVVSSALTPTGAGDARARIREAVALIESIKPVAGQEDQYYLMHGTEMITFSKEEVQAIRARTVQALAGAAGKIRQVDNESSARLGNQASTDIEHPGAGFAVSLFTDQTTYEAIDQFQTISAGTSSALSRLHAAKNGGDLMTMAEELANAEEAAIRGKLFVDAHVEDIQTSGEQLITGLEITTAVAFTIVMIGTAGAAAPAVGGFVTGAGFSGATATGLTIAGTGAVIGAEGFVLGGGSAAAGELVSGGSLSEAGESGWKEGKKWGKTGVKIGVSAAAAPLVAGQFGVGAQGVGKVSNVVRSAGAGGVTNVAVEGGGKAVLDQELISAEDAAVAFGSGALGSATGPLTQKVANPALRGATNVAVGATTSGAITYAQTGDTGEALESAAVGGATALGTGRARKRGDEHPKRAVEAGKRARNKARSAKRKAASTLAAATIGLETSGALPNVPVGQSHSTPRASAAHVASGTPRSRSKQRRNKPPTEQAAKATASQRATPPAGARTRAKTKNKQQTQQPPTPAPKSAQQQESKQTKPKTKSTQQAAPSTKGSRQTGAKRGGARKPKVDVSKQSLDERIAAAELELQAARAKTTDYFAERKKAGRSRKGGPKKAIDNAKEKLWLLKRQKAYPDRQILHGCSVKGVRSSDGTFTAGKNIAKTGREPDFIELADKKATMGELKSEWEFDKSLTGGPGTRKGGKTTVASGSKMGGQFVAEDKIIAHARSVQGKVVVTGFDLKTGKRVEIELDPDQMRRAIFSSTAGWGIGSEWTN